MADLYQANPNNSYLNVGQTTATPIRTGNPNTDSFLDSLPEDQKQQAHQDINSPLMGDEVAQLLQNRRETGYVPTEQEYQTYAKWSDKQQHSILDGLSEGFNGVMHTFGEAAGQFIQHPLDTTEKLPASVAEAFFQGTRNFYGMLAQSQDPNSVLFKWKNALASDGSSDAYNQFLEALKFNDHSADLAEGKTTLLMDKDAINHEVTQAASYIADPTLFIPFGEIASGGLKAIGMGSKLAAIGAKADMIGNKILAGGLKWGVGTPLEFMGGAVRGTIDYATHIGGQAFEATTGVGINEFKATAKLAGVGSSVAGLAGHGVPVLSDISNAYIAGTSARGLGEAVNAIAGQIDKQAAFGRGINSYARQALEDTKAAGIALSPHAQSLLKILDAVDPLFSYSSDILKGAAHGAVIGGTLGYLGEGEEGLYHGIGAGVALGGIGAGVGRLTSDALGGTGIMRRAIQSEMVLKGYESMGQTEKVQFWKELRLRAKDPDMVNAVISGIDNVCPLHEIHAMNPEEFNSWSEKNGYDVHTGKFAETSRILDTLENRNHKGEVLGILRDNGDKFAGDSNAFKEDLNTNKSMKLRWDKLTEEQKGVVLENIDSHADFIKENGTGKLKDYYADHTAAEKYTQQVNDTHTKSPEAAKKQIDALLSGHKDANGELTQRGKLLADKLRNEGYLDKDGSILARRSMMDSDLTLKQFQSIAGMVTRREADGKVHIYINTSAMDRSTLPHELFHAIMKESPMKKEFIDRLIQKLIGKYDSKGNVIEAGSVTPDELKKFFNRYIESENRNAHPDLIKSLKDNLDKSIEEYKSRGKGERVDISTATPLEHYAEEFGAYYFANFLQGKNRDFLFHGGQLHGIAGILDSAKSSWLNFWGDKIGNASSFDFSNIKDFQISKSFEGKRNAAFDSFMTDFVRANSMINKGGFDINKLSPDAQAHYLEANGIRGFGVRDKTGKIVKFKSDQQAVAEQIRIGKEIYKILNGLDPELRKNGTITDGEGNLSGRPNTAEVDAIVKSGLVPKAWIDKVVRGYDILEGKGGNLIDFGYQGKTAQIGDYAWPRLVGSDVPFKHRTAILTGVDFKVGADGKMYSLFHTLDKKVIDARGNNLWADPRNRALWGGDRSAFEADFFKYLSNASKAAGDVTRRPSHLLLDHGDGMGTLRRNTLHQMLGMAKSEGEVYINKPTAEIPFGIRQSVTTFNVDGISNLRVDNGVRWDYNTDNAAKDLSRNFMPSEMKSEETPNGRIIKHATGYRILEGTDKKVRLISPEGKDLGKFDKIADAGRAAQKHFNDTFDKSVEGKDKPVPNTEIPPSRQAYIERGSSKSIDKYFGNHIEKFRENLTVLIDRIINGNKQDSAPKDVVDARLTKIKESVSKGDVKMTDLEYIRDRAYSTIIDTSRLPYFDYSYFWERIGQVMEDSKRVLGAEYDAMYPMEIKSALHPRLAQIFQDYPNLSAQTLLKKLVIYGSQGSRMFQEATEIGLVDLLKNKSRAIQRTSKVFDPKTGLPTGEIKTEEFPVAFKKIPILDKDGKPTGEFKGETWELDKRIGGLMGTNPILDPKEILDFAKSKEIKVTIEEGAREVNGMNTSRYTLGGAKDNYKETAIRINPEYAHGIRGHYGEDTIVHFRTTERLDADGNRHLFIEEVQANNTDDYKAFSEIALRRMKADLETLKQYKKDAIDAGVFVERVSDTGNTTYVNEKENWFEEYGYSEIYNMIREEVRKEITGTGFDYAMARDDITNAITNDISYVINQQHLKTGEEFAERIGDLLLTGYPTDKSYRIFEAVRKSEGGKQFIESAGRRIERDYKFFQDKGTPLLDRDLHEAPYNATSIMEHQRVREHISDLSTSIAQSFTKAKTHPMTSSKDWTLTALKGIIRQAIRDGLDKITLTHPDDSPTVSHLNGSARHGLYGKIIPEVWGSWLRKYGIEMKQTNKLADATIDTAKGQMAEITNKLHDANKAVLEHFEQVKGGEDPATINSLAQLMATPVHEGDMIGTKITNTSKNVNDTKLRQLIFDVALLKASERDAYNRIQKLRKGGVRAVRDDSILNLYITDISAEAIDRGMTFELNDRLKRDFLDGKIQTHAMPNEGNDIVPNAKGSVKLKAGFSRVYHQTTPDNIESIKKNGLLVSKSRPSSESRGVSVSETPFYGNNPELVTVELQVPTEKLKQANGSSLLEDVPAKNIIAVHEPWHEKVRYIEKNKQTLNEVLNGDMDFMLGDGSSEAKAIEYIKNKYNKKSSRFMPSEGEQGGRTYTDAQLNNEFIGKFASEHPEIASKYLIRLKETESDEGTGYKIVVYDKNTKKPVARSKWEIIQDNNGKQTEAAADVEILDPTYKGKQLSHLMQSERLERSRFLGAESVRSQITNQEGIPIKNYARTIGEKNGEITSAFTDRVNENGETGYVPATMENFKQEMDLSKSHDDGTWKPTVYYRANLDPKAWYQPNEKIGTQSSNVELLLEGMRSGRIFRTSSYKGLGLEDSILIAHTPDTAKIGQVTAGDKALADLQGGIFYAIANGNRIWASNFAGEGKTNQLINFAKEQLEKNPNKKTYILLVKPITEDNSKIFASVDGARGVSNIFKHLNDSKVMTDLRYIKALKNSAEIHLKMSGLESLGKDELYARIDDALLNSKKNGIGFKERANFTREIARQFDEDGAFDSKKSKDALIKSFHNGFERGFSIVEMERVFGNLMAEDIIKDVPAGHVYGALEITSPLKESQSSNHRGYDASIEHESGEPAKLIIFDKTDHVTNIVNRKEGDVIPIWDKEKGSYMSYTGGNIPYQEVKGKSHMPFQPAEVHGITPSEGFKWFKRSKLKNIPHEREIVMDNILNDVLEEGLSYNEAAQKNNDTFKNVYRIVSNYVRDNPSALKLTPAERVKSYDYKWFYPFSEDTKTRVPLSKAIKIDTALDDIANKRLDIVTASKKYQIPEATLSAYITKARNSKKGFPYFLQGRNSTARDADPYVFNESTKKMKVSDENKKLMLSMYEDEGLSVQNEIAPQFGISPNMIYKFIIEQKNLRDNKPSMQPAEQWNKDQSLGSKIITSTKGYIIMQSNTKFKLYNPYKTLIGVYDNIDQAKNKVEKSKLQR